MAQGSPSAALVFGGIVAVVVAGTVVACGSVGSAVRTVTVKETGGPPQTSPHERAKAIHDYLERKYGSDPSVEAVKSIGVVTDTARLEVNFPGPGGPDINPGGLCDAVLQSGIVEHARIYVAGTGVLNTGCP
jgi:hypothetical protein